MARRQECGRKARHPTRSAAACNRHARTSARKAEPLQIALERVRSARRPGRARSSATSRAFQDMRALSAGRGAGIEHAQAMARDRGRRAARCAACVLDRDFAAGKPGSRSTGTGVLKHQRRIASRARRNARFGEALHNNLAMAHAAPCSRAAHIGGCALPAARIVLPRPRDKRRVRGRSTIEGAGSAPSGSTDRASTERGSRR